MKTVPRVEEKRQPADLEPRLEEVLADPSCIS